jgi:hypothetical protein
VDLLEDLGWCHPLCDHLPRMNWNMDSWTLESLTSNPHGLISSKFRSAQHNANRWCTTCGASLAGLYSISPGHHLQVLQAQAVRDIHKPQACCYTPYAPGSSATSS